MKFSGRVNVQSILSDAARVSPPVGAIGMLPKKDIFWGLQTPIPGAIAIIDTALQDAGEAELRK